MKGYLSAERGASGRSIPLESRAEVYRDPEEGQEIVVATEGSVSNLGISDVTVSRKKGDQAPVLIQPQSESIEIRNAGNSNAVVVSTEGDTQELEEGFSARVRRDAVIKLGYQTELRLTVEREAREEYVIEGDVDTGGDVVMGDQTQVDQRTTVEDVVAKDLSVSGEEPAEVSDVVATDLRVGGGDEGTDDEDSEPTKEFCERHEMAYTGPVCPKCAETDGEDERYGETMFCIFCGESIPALAQVCPNCGEELPDH